MKRFVAGVPKLTFKNMKTDEEVKIDTLVKYERKSLDFIHVKDVFISEELYAVESWLNVEDGVELVLRFDIFHANGERIGEKFLPHYENFIVKDIIVPYVISSDCESASKIGIDIKVVC